MPEARVRRLAARFHAKWLESDFWLIPLRIEAPILTYAKCALHSQ
jgi:hypothetical protein